MSNKPDCYQCKHRNNVPGDCHSSCSHPSMTSADGFLAAITGIGNPAINATGDSHAKRMGWFSFPINYDPAWLLTCDGFEQK